MKWSTLLPTGSIGIRVTFDQVVPSADVLSTMSLAVSFSKRESCQATYTTPAALISAEGNGEVRSPATRCLLIIETFTEVFHVAPPLSEVNARIWPSLP